ncbi:unnamed protein product [Prunus armeniaca]
MASIPFCRVFPFLSPLIPSIILSGILGAQDLKKERNGYTCWFEGWLIGRQYLLFPWTFCLKTCSFLPSSSCGLPSSSMALSFSQMLKPLLLLTSNSNSKLSERVRSGGKHLPPVVGKRAQVDFDPVRPSPFEEAPPSLLEGISLCGFSYKILNFALFLGIFTVTRWDFSKGCWTPSSFLKLATSTSKPRCSGMWLGDGVPRHTFVYSWGEFTPTLEDVANIFHLPLCDSQDHFHIALTPEDKLKLKALRKGAPNSSSTSLQFSNWIQFFGDVNRNEPYRLAAFISLWLG